MQYSEGSVGRVFVLRLEDGERVPDVIEKFAGDHGIKEAAVMLIGGIGGGRIVVGPEEREDGKIVPMLHPLSGVHEASGVGTIFPDEGGNPVLHMHSALGREGKASCGCVRAGIDVWIVGEVVIIELCKTGGVRRKDAATGFELLVLD